MAEGDLLHLHNSSVPRVSSRHQHLLLRLADLVSSIHLPLHLDLLATWKVKTISLDSPSGSAARVRNHLCIRSADFGCHLSILSPMKSTRLLFLFLLTISIGQASSEKKCRFIQYQCGDVCVYNDYPCHCGNVTLNQYSSSYCCTEPGDKCTVGRRYRDGYRDTTCTRGTPIPRSETCNDKCPAEEG